MIPSPELANTEVQILEFRPGEQCVYEVSTCVGCESVRDVRLQADHALLAWLATSGLVAVWEWVQERM